MTSTIKAVFTIAKKGEFLQVLMYLVDDRWLQFEDASAESQDWTAAAGGHIDLSLHDWLFNEERKEKLMEALRLINEKDLALIELRYFERRSYREIGEIISVTENNAKVIFVVVSNPFALNQAGLTANLCPNFVVRKAGCWKQWDFLSTSDTIHGIDTAQPWRGRSHLGDLNPERICHVLLGCFFPDFLCTIPAATLHFCGNQNGNGPRSPKKSCQTIFLVLWPPFPRAKFVW